MKKKLFPIVIALLMVFAMMPMTAGTVFADNIDVPKYVVNLTSGSGSGNPISFTSQQDGRYSGISDNGSGVANGQFYSTGQVMYFRFPDCPDTFTGQDGTVFTGWKLNGSGNTHAPGYIVEATDPMNLTATWAEAGDASLFSLTVDKGVLEPQFSPEVTNYNVTVNCEGSPVEVIATAKPAQNGATVTYDDEDSCPALSDCDSVEIKVTNGANKKVYTISVYVLYSITTEIDGNGSVKTYNNYQPDLGETSTALNENTFKLVATPSDGWKFKEWQLISGGGTLNNPTSTTATYRINGANAVVKAIFVPTYTVTFKTDGGKWDDGTTTDKEVTVEEGGTAIPPGIPTREGYKFIGWDEDCSGISSDLTVTAMWKKVVNIKNVSISIEAPECGTKVKLVEDADGDGQYSGRTPHTHPWPAVTVSSDEAKLFSNPYHGGSEVTGVWTDNEQGNITWETPNSGYFTGNMEGGNEYYARFELDAVGDYVFGSDRYDVIKVNGQKPVYVSNDSDTHVVVVAKVKASHVTGSETITKATPGIDGSIDHVCEKCGNVYSEAISAPKDFLLSKTSYTYSGSANKPSVTVKDADGKKIDPSNYSVTYKNNINAGTATATVTFKGDYYEGSKNLTFKINKAANPLKIKAKTATVKYSKLKKKAQPLAVTKVITFTKQLKDKKTYTLSAAKKGKTSFKKYFTVNKTTGKVTVKKGLKKGTYKVTVKVKAAGTTNYKPSALKTVTFTIKVK